MRVYFVGASGTGKTTLQRYVTERYGLTPLPSAVRAVMEEGGFTPDQVRTDLKAGESFQLAVWRKQRELEEAAGPAFVADRAFDCLAYTAEQTAAAWQIGRGKDFHAYVDRLKEGGVATFFVRPTSITLQRRLTDKLHDGTRDVWTEPGCVHRIDGMLQLLLEVNQVPYHPIHALLVRDRVRQVYGVLDLVRKLYG